jgi:hypothetical protein
MKTMRMMNNCLGVDYQIKSEVLIFKISPCDRLLNPHYQYLIGIYGQNLKCASQKLGQGYLA